VTVERIHGNRSQAQRTSALEGFKSGRYQVLVATDIAARGIDVEALGHVINFDVPAQSEDYIHRVGRTGRAEMTGSAFTLAAPEEESSLRSIEKTIGRPVPRVTLPDFDYHARPSALEVPHAQRIAAIRARKAEERQRAQSNAERRAYAERQRLNTSTQPATARPNRLQSNRHRSSSTVWSTSNTSRRRHRG
jgi:ATP-dependent RNA helicase RhlE